MVSQLRLAIEQPRVSIVIPARNEARNLELVLPELPPVYEVILVDGNSVDDTVETARRVMPGIRVIQQTRRGKGNALVCGFLAATGDIIVMFDADGSADPAEIPAFVSALQSGADFAKGSRFCPGGGSEDITLFRSAGNRGLNVLTNLLLKTRYTDLCYGYNAFWADILHRLELPEPGEPEPASAPMTWGDGFEIETVLNCRVAAAELSVTEVPSVERSRMFGASNLNAIRDGIRVLKTILTERSRPRPAPHHAGSRARQLVAAHAESSGAMLRVEEIA
jgi:glycosyltransferase involved in cell wall biosynthesis